MTRAQFYHNVEDPVALACELVARAHASGRLISIRAAGPEMAARIDHELWTFDPQSFVPHVRADSPLAPQTPVVIHAAAPVTWPHEDVLFNLADDLPEAFSGFRMIVEFVGRGDASRNPARARWMHYKREGVQLTAFDATTRERL